jgi:serine/threonine protein kinase
VRDALVKCSLQHASVIASSLFIFVQQVAIKIIDTRKIREEYVRANLHREARIMASLRHPNIIRLYETLKVGDYFCTFIAFS